MRAARACSSACHMENMIPKGSSTPAAATTHSSSGVNALSAMPGPAYGVSGTGAPSAKYCTAIPTACRRPARRAHGVVARSAKALAAAACGAAAVGQRLWRGAVLLWGCARCGGCGAAHVRIAHAVPVAERAAHTVAEQSGAEQLRHGASRRQHEAHQPLVHAAPQTARRDGRVELQAGYGGVGHGEEREREKGRKGEGEIRGPRHRRATFSASAIPPCRRGCVRSNPA